MSLEFGLSVSGVRTKVLAKVGAAVDDAVAGFLRTV
jgi:hypothetical protein